MFLASKTSDVITQYSQFLESRCQNEEFKRRVLDEHGIEPDVAGRCGAGPRSGRPRDTAQPWTPLPAWALELREAKPQTAQKDERDRLTSYPGEQAVGGARRQGRNVTTGVALTHLVKLDS